MPRLTEQHASEQRARDRRTLPNRRLTYNRRQADRFVPYQAEPPLETGVLWQ